MPGYKGDVRPLEVRLEEYLRVNVYDLDVKISDLRRQLADLEASKRVLQGLQSRFIDTATASRVMVKE